MEFNKFSALLIYVLLHRTSIRIFQLLSDGLHAEGSPIDVIDGWWDGCSVSIGKIHFVRMVVHDDSAGNLIKKIILRI
jgi:hypothetical protein